MTPSPVLLGYFIGSIPTGYWIGRILKGIDVRNYGSGNLGATNVFRVLGWKAGVATLLIDIAKGYLAVKFCFFLHAFESRQQYYAFIQHIAPASVAAISVIKLAWLSGMSAILGHSFSPWVGFRGGKGVATAGGVLLALLPLEAEIAVGVFAVFFAFSRIVSLSSIMAAIALPIATAFLAHDSRETLITSIIAVFIIWRHRENIVRLLNGTEKPLHSHEQPN